MGKHDAWHGKSCQSMCRPIFNDWNMTGFHVIDGRQPVKVFLPVPSGKLPVVFPVFFIQFVRIKQIRIGMRQPGRIPFLFHPFSVHEFVQFPEFLSNRGLSIIRTRRTIFRRCRIRIMTSIRQVLFYGNLFF